MPLTAEEKKRLLTPETLEYLDRIRDVETSGAYTIDIPGLTDFIRWPALENEELKFQRFIRFKTQEPLLPEPLRWIPDVINKLDDAQDLLFTALVLARPLLKKIPTWWLPGLGWTLFANDVLNLQT